MSETTEVRKCPVCDGLGVVSIPMNSDAGIATTECRACKGTGVIVTDIVTPYVGNSEQFDEVFVGEIKKSGSNRLYFAPREDCDYKMHYANMDCFIEGWIMNKKINSRVQISCKPGKIVIERLEEK